MDIWWIDEPRVLGSCNPTTQDLEELSRRGFTVIVSLLDEDVQAPYYDLARLDAIGYRRRNIAVEDFRPPKIEQLVEFVEFVERQPADAKIIVHCQAGIGRTGTFAAAYWIAKGVTADEAVKKIRSARPHAVETQEQRQALQEFERRRAAAPGNATHRP